MQLPINFTTLFAAGVAGDSANYWGQLCSLVSNSVTPNTIAAGIMHADSNGLYGLGYGAYFIAVGI